MRPVPILLLGLTSLIGVACAASPPALTKGGTDGDIWARRNVEVLEHAVRDAPDGREADVSAFLGFSVGYNPLLLRDPYAGQVAKLIEDYQERADERALWQLDRYIALLRRPEAERAEAKQSVGGGTAADPPDSVLELASGAANALLMRRDAQAAKWLARAESLARGGEDWAVLAGAYAGFISSARRRDDAAALSDFVYRLLVLLREHPEVLQRAEDAGTGVGPTAFAHIMLSAGRREQLETFIPDLPASLRAKVGAELAARLAETGNFEEARAVIEQHVRPADAHLAEKLLAAFDGKIEEITPDVKLKRLRASVANGHAARGRVETAGTILIALQSPGEYNPVGAESLAYFEWARLARIAADNGHPDAARRGFELAAEAVTRDDLRDDNQKRELRALTREAAAIGAFDVAADMLSTTSSPGAWTRVKLARAHRERGNEVRARELLDEALKGAYQANSRAGSAMAAAAVELQRLGEADRAERVLLDALSRIEGVDFGFGGTRGVVDAAVEMGRPDLLDRLYEQGEPGERLLLCIVAARRATANTPIGRE